VRGGVVSGHSGEDRGWSGGGRCTGKGGGSRQQPTRRHRGGGADGHVDRRPRHPHHRCDGGRRPLWVGVPPNAVSPGGGWRLCPPAPPSFVRAGTPPTTRHAVQAPRADALALLLADVAYKTYVALGPVLLRVLLVGVRGSTGRGRRLRGREWRWRRRLPCRQRRAAADGGDPVLSSYGSRTGLRAPRRSGQRAPRPSAYYLP